MANFVEGFPSFERFRQDLLQVYPDGDLEEGYRLLRSAVENSKKSIHGDLITWSYVLKSFTAHHDWWAYQFKRSEDSGYLQEKQRQKRFDIVKFISDELWNRDWVPQKGSRERNLYLFGSTDQKSLSDQLYAFKETFHTT